MRVLVLEDEESIRGFIRINLKRNDIDVTEAQTGEEALRIVKEQGPFHMALLDVMLPTKMSGFDVCAEIRRMYPKMGIIMLTAKSQDTDKAEGLEIGADDYVTKPFSPVELIARIKALYRRLEIPEREPAKLSLSCGAFSLQLKERKLLKGQTEIDITPTEFAILKLFMERPNQGISRDEILDAVWGKHFVGDLKIVDVNIRRIRQKIESDPSHPAHIETVWGYGYLWKKDSGFEQHQE
ncbi:MULTISPECIES: response regulator transcription factor [Paenibacillus]|uniref:Response regulator n=1 Tax=Paenibacillus lutrae TaxID=2078573 RepID=A0A7X3JYW4_9BACL|nr:MULTISPECIES: response regulator transcription factor [Paenibacillus]MVO99437.1 response regulator [Paenibacillus lutrae]